MTRSTTPFLFTVLLAIGCSGCASDGETPADGQVADVGQGSDGGTPVDSTAGGDGQTDAGGEAGPLVDAEPDTSATPPSYRAVGTPTTFSAGRGDPPVVFWPKPVYAHPDVPFEFTMVTYDKEHDRVLFSLVGAPAGMTIDENGTLRWDPVVDGGPYTFTIEVDDGRGAPVQVPVTLTVDASRFLFVAPNGVPGNDGSLGAPLDDIDAALRLLVSRGHGTLYLRGGSYDITWNWEANGVTSPFRNATATPEAPLVVRGYPGEWPVLDCGGSGHGPWPYAGSHILHADMEVRRAASRGGALIDGTNNVFQNVIVRDSDWDHAANCTGFLVRGRNAVCHRCVAEDNYDRASTHWNSSNYLVYADTAAGDRDLFILDSYSAGSITGFKMKHAGEGRLFLHGSRDAGSGHGWAGMDNETTIRFNTFESNNSGMTVAITDPSAYTRGNMLLEYNTVVDAKIALQEGGTYAGDTGVTVRRNVLTVAGSPGSDQSDPHFAWVAPWEDAPSTVMLDSNENCWWGSSSSTGFRFGRNTAGFSGWQGWGFDADSVFADPAFAGSSYAVASTSDCFTAATRVGAWE